MARKRAVSQYEIEQYCDGWYKYGTKSGAYKYAFPDAEKVDFKFHDLPEVQKQLKKDLAEMQEKDPTIMTADEILSMYSAIARGEEKDQFGLDASLDTRIAALKELGKRFGLASEVIEVKRSGDFADKMKRAREREKERLLLNGEKAAEN